MWIGKLALKRFDFDAVKFLFTEFFLRLFRLNLGNSTDHYFTFNRFVYIDFECSKCCSKCFCSGVKNLGILFRWKRFANEIREMLQIFEECEWKQWKSVLHKNGMRLYKTMEHCVVSNCSQCVCICVYDVDFCLCVYVMGVFLVGAKHIIFYMKWKGKNDLTWCSTGYETGTGTLTYWNRKMKRKSLLKSSIVSFVRYLAILRMVQA